MNRFNISTRLLLLVLTGAGLVLAAVIGYSYSASRAMLEETLESRAKSVVQATANHIETVGAAVAKVVQGMAVTLEVKPPDDEAEVHALLASAVRDNKEVYGAAVAFEPGAMPPGFGHPAPYVFEHGGGLVQRNLDYRYDIHDWYCLPKVLGKPVWTEPYYDEGGGEALMVTYSVPFYNRNTGALMGVVTSDISLAWLTELLPAMDVGRRGFAFLLSRNGAFVSHPIESLILRENVFSLAERCQDPQLRALGREMVRCTAPGYLFADNPITRNQPAWLAYEPIEGADWTMVAVFPRSELLEPLIRLSQINGRIAAVGFVLLFLVVLLIARSISRPIAQLDKAALTLASGDLDAHLPDIPGQDEVARLARSFSTMRVELMDYMARLAQTVKAKERIEGELRIARDIQMSLVPRTFPPFPKRNDLDIYATMEPAKEVGGDFYDFFLADASTLCLAIGDVSGKGMPAALFMAVTRSFWRSLSRENLPPAEVLRRLNDDLAQDNDACMFVTLFTTIIDLETGVCRYANGGHNPPLIRRASGAVEELPRLAGMAAGPIEGVEYAEDEFALAPGDLLFLYTDGVTEAMNMRDELYGEQRTTARLEAAQDRDCTQVLAHMRQDVCRFIEGAEQSDDITMVAFRYFGSAGKPAE